MKTLLKLLLKTQHQRNHFGLAKTEKGMTLVELLVGAIMAFLIITPMLGFVVDMLNTDRREQVKSNTEQDLQAAVDFIAQDLSQAIYIYDRAGITAINNTTNKLPAAGDATKIPILVFWKRQQIKNTLPINSAIEPKDCDKSANVNKCNDTYVLSLVAYYQFKDNDTTWCQPSGGTCPTRIARYEIRDGVRNPYAVDPADSYYKSPGQIDKSKTRDAAFNPDFDFSKPTVNVTMGPNFPNPEVLVNYIDHSTANVPVPTGTQCQTLLGVTPPAAAPAFNPNDLLITDTSSPPTHSFYACVDTSKNLARVTIRGNSLRRLQANNADFKTTSSAFFPTASVQVQGLGARGK